MFWADKIADEVERRYADVIKSGQPIVVRDEKTASGKVHVGSLRSAALHAIVADILRSRGHQVEFYFEINDFDPMDGIPSYLDQSVYEQYMGHPLYKVPSPEEGFDNFAELYGQEYVEVVNKIGFGATVYRATELYKEGKMNDQIRAVLDKKEIVHNNISSIQFHCDSYSCTTTTKTKISMSQTKTSSASISTNIKTCTCATI